MTYSQSILKNSRISVLQCYEFHDPLTQNKTKENDYTINKIEIRFQDKFFNPERFHCNQI